MARNKKMQQPSANDCSLNQDTLDFLKLGKQPFGQEILSADTFYHSAELEKISENLKHQAQFSDLLLIVEGPYGSGKTSLYRQFIQTIIPNIKLLPVQAETTDTLVQIQQKISIHLQDLGDANHLDSNLKSLQTFDQTPLLIMDDAHVLSDTTLQELFRYQQQLSTEHDVNLKFSLFANPGLDQTLEKITDIPPAKIYTQTMPAYTDKLIEPYIQFKLNAAGYHGEKLLDDTSLQLINKKSDGTALNIMQIASKLIEKQVKKLNSPSLAGWAKVLVIGLVILTLLAGLLVYLGVFQSLTPKNATTPDSLPEIPLAIESNREEIASTEVDTHPVDALTPETDTPVEILPPSNNAPAATDSEATEQDMVSSVTPENKTGSAIEDISTDNIQTLTDTPEKTTAKDFVTEKPTTSKPEAIETSTPPLVPITKTAPTVKTKTPVIPVTEKPEIKKAETKTAAVVKNITTSLDPALQQLNKMGLHDATWLKQQSSTAWTIQLLGARDPETLLQFSRSHQLKQNTAWYKTWLKGQPYYVLVYSTYSSRDQARSAIATLPGSLRNTKPWVKSMKAVQQAIK